MARVTDPILGLSRRTADLGLSAAVIGDRFLSARRRWAARLNAAAPRLRRRPGPSALTSNGHPLVEYLMPAAYEAYSEVVVESVTRMPVHAVLRSGGEVTWSYQVTENADAPPEPETSAAHGP